MKTSRLLTAVAIVALGSSLSGCLGLGGLPGAGGSSVEAQVKAVQAILTDPHCGHDDEAEIITGAAGVPGSFHAKAARHCPMPLPGLVVPNDPIAAAIASPPPK